MKVRILLFLQRASGFQFDLGQVFAGLERSSAGTGRARPFGWSVSFHRRCRLFALAASS